MRRTPTRSSSGHDANVTFEVARSKDSLRVPATALRLQPAAELIEPSATLPTDGTKSDGAKADDAAAMSGDPATPGPERGAGR